MRRTKERECVKLWIFSESKKWLVYVDVTRRWVLTSTVFAVVYYSWFPGCQLLLAGTVHSYIVVWSYFGWTEDTYSPILRCFHQPFLTSRVKGKAVPLRSIEAHLGGRRYSSYSFLTSALEGGEWSASRPGRALPPGKEPPVPTV
jgi:hypothetical protein